MHMYTYVEALTAGTPKQSEVLKYMQYIYIRCTTEAYIVSEMSVEDPAVMVDYVLHLMLSERACVHSMFF